MAVRYQDRNNLKKGIIRNALAGHQSYIKESSDMKPSTTNAFCCAAAILFAASSAVFAQATTATTDPVGFITLNVAGATGGTPALSFKGLSLTRAVEYQGSAETAAGTSITDNEATWTDNQFNGANGAYYVEIAGGPGAGTTYDITATAAATKTITLAQGLANGVVAPVSFKIRKHWTIGSVFGANNEAGLGGGDSATADQILISNGTGYDIYYYQTAGAGGTGWRKSPDTATDASGSVIYPEDGVVIKRIQASAVNVVLMGAVKTGQSSIPIQAGNNITGNVFAAPMTLQSSGIYTGNAATGLAAGGPSTADLVLIWDGTNYAAYYYQSGGTGGTGWRSVTDASTDAGGTPIPVGGSVVIRRNGATGFDWKAPQHPASL
jgi:uncharacterized protein (TIGR02597 family)